MAPPTRTYGAPTSASTDNDPLSSLMAPPPVRIPSQTSLPSGPPGGPPIRRVPAAPTTKVWTPPVNIMKPSPTQNTLSDPFSQFSTPTPDQSTTNGSEPLSFQSNGMNSNEYSTQIDQQQNSFQNLDNSSLPPPPMQSNQYSQYGQFYQGQGQGQGQGQQEQGFGQNGNSYDNSSNVSQNNYSLPPPPL